MIGNIHVSVQFSDYCTTVVKVSLYLACASCLPLLQKALPFQCCKGGVYHFLEKKIVLNIFLKRYSTHFVILPKI